MAAEDEDNQSLEHLIHQAFHQQTASKAIKHLINLINDLDMDPDVVFPGIPEAWAEHGLIVISSIYRYVREMKTLVTSKPFGIEMNTLSPSVQFVLFPAMPYPPSDEDIQKNLELGVKIRTQGPQTILYVMDDFLDEADNIPS